MTKKKTPKKGTKKTTTDRRRGGGASRKSKPGEDAERRRQQYLGLRESGMTRREACEVVGISYSCVSEWRRRWPEFRALEEEAREAGLDYQRERLRRIAEAQEHDGPQHAIAAINALIRAEGVAMNNRLEISGPGGGPVQTESQVTVESDAVRAALAQWASRLGVDPPPDEG